MATTCPKCFHALSDDAVTCGNCGARIRPPRPSPPPGSPIPPASAHAAEKREAVTQARPAAGADQADPGTGAAPSAASSQSRLPPHIGASTPEAPPPEARPVDVEYGQARASLGGGGESVMLTLISAALFLYVGFGMSLVGVSQHAVYNNSVAAFTWGARVIGIALLVVAGLSFTGMAFALILDAIVAVIAALGCLIIGGIWVAYGDASGWLILLFGVLNASAARGAVARLMRRPRRITP